MTTCTQAAPQDDATPDAPGRDIRTVVETCATLRVCRDTLLAMYHKGQIPGFRVGKSIRFRESQVLAALERQD